MENGMSNTVELSTSPVFAEVRDDGKDSNQSKDSPLDQGASYSTPAGQDVANPLPDYEVYPIPPGNNQVYPPAYGYPLQYGMSNGSQQLYYAHGPQPYSMSPYMASQQQQATNVVISGQRNIEPNQPKMNFTGPIVLACFTAWCCNCLFGLIAFILAMIGNTEAEIGNKETAMKLSRASYGVSIAGIALAIIVTAVVLGVVFGLDYHSYNYYNSYSYYG